MAKTRKNGGKTGLPPGVGVSDRRRRSLWPVMDQVDALQDFYDYSPVGYLTLDRGGRILEANPTAVVMMTVVRSELIGQLFYDYVALRYPDILGAHLRRVFTD